MCLQEAKDVPAVVEMLSKAKSILGYDLLDLCLNGPKEKLDDTAFAQPALFVAGLAACVQGSASASTVLWPLLASSPLKRA